MGELTACGTTHEPNSYRLSATFDDSTSLCPPGLQLCGCSPDSQLFICLQMNFLTETDMPCIVSTKGASILRRGQSAESTGGQC